MMIRCDNKFKSIMDEVKDSLSVEMDYSDPGVHEHTAEQNNRVIEDVKMRKIWGMAQVIDCMVAIEKYSWLIIIYFCVQSGDYMVKFLWENVG